MSVYTGLWLIWILTFFLIELPALRNRQPGDTLSEHVWAWCSIKGKGRAWRLRRLALVILLAWLSLHMLTGGQF